MNDIFANAREDRVGADLPAWRLRTVLRCKTCDAPQADSRNPTCSYCGRTLTEDDRW